MIICGCGLKNMEYILNALGLMARRDHKHLTVTAPDEQERNDDLCRYITWDENIHTDIGKGMADVLVIYKYSAGIRHIEQLKNSGKLILVKSPVKDLGMSEDDLQRSSPSARRDAQYLKDLLYLKQDALIVERSPKDDMSFEFYAEERVLRLAGLR